MDRLVGEIEEEKSIKAGTEENDKSSVSKEGIKKDTDKKQDNGSGFVVDYVRRNVGKDSKKEDKIDKNDNFYSNNDEKMLFGNIWYDGKKSEKKRKKILKKKYKCILKDLNNLKNTR